MNACIARPAVVACILMNVLVSAQEPPELDDGRQWHVAAARPLLRRVIRAQPEADAASHAYELLSRIYLRSGQYRRLIQNLDEWAKIFPDRAEVLEEQADVELFRGLPDQINGPRRRFRLVHEGGDDFSIPLAINGQPTTYLLDTGAWVSVMTEAEAARLDLIPASPRGILGDASGIGVPVRTAIAKKVTIGPLQFKDVSFAISGPSSRRPCPQWRKHAVPALPSRTKQTNEITGLGGTAKFDAVLLPAVHFVISDAEVALSPAHVTLQTLPSIGGECCIGNIGLDLLIQSGRVTIDFSSMTLRLN